MVAPSFSLIPGAGGDFIDYLDEIHQHPLPTLNRTMGNQVNIGIFGLGDMVNGIGTGLVRLIKAEKTRDCTRNINIKRIVVKDLVKPRHPYVDSSLVSDRHEDIIDDPEIDIVVELIGGIEPARSLILRSLKAGKHVVTANKAVIATYGREIFTLARTKGLKVGFEACVGGSIPIIKILSDSMPNRIITIEAILNGTTNYILTRMHNGLDFQQALEEARVKGFAEADPSLDISGRDSAEKLAILASIAFETEIKPDDIFVEGIEDIRREDTAFAGELGCVIKLLAIAKGDGRIECRVHPALVPANHQLATVSYQNNAVYYRGEATGAQTIQGKGAGQMPTANAVLSDIKNIIRGTIYPMPTYKRQLPLVPHDSLEMEYYLRFTALDRPGVLSKISGVFGRYNISIASVIQKGTGDYVPLMIKTHRAQEGNIQRALAEIEGLGTTLEEVRLIRVIYD